MPQPRSKKYRGPKYLLWIAVVGFKGRKQDSTSSCNKKNGNPNMATNIPTSSILPLPSSSSESMPTNTNNKYTKNITSREMDDRRQKGLFFQCDKKFVPGHKCKKRQLYMLTVNNDESEETQVEERLEDGVQLIGEEALAPQLSLNAINGTCSYQTMRVKGHVGTRMLFLLIDSGSTHNLMDNKVAKQLGYTLEPIDELRVTAANGNELTCTEMCRTFQWKMRGYQFWADFLILPLDNYDMGWVHSGQQS